MARARPDLTDVAASVVSIHSLKSSSRGNACSCRTRHRPSGGLRGAGVLVQIEVLASCMSPACCFADAPTCIKRFEAGVALGLQDAVHAGQSGALQLDALAGVDLALAVQRKVIGVLAHRDMRQQAGASRATRDGPAWRGGLNDGLALRADVLRLHMTNHHEARRHDLQHLGHVLAEQAQHTVAALAGISLGIGWLVHPRLARQVTGQRLACGALALVGIGLRRRAFREAGCAGLVQGTDAGVCIKDGLLALELLDQQLERGQLRQALRTRTELRTLEAQDFQLEFLHHQARFEQLGLAARERVLEGFGVVGQGRGHAPVDAFEQH